MPTEQEQATKAAPNKAATAKDKKKKDQEDELVCCVFGWCFGDASDHDDMWSVCLFYWLLVQSPEDQQLKQELELLVERAKDPKPEIQKNALESLKSHIRSSTTSMTSVPKPLKFLRPFYPELVTFYNGQMEYENKVLFECEAILLKFGLIPFIRLI